jgi:hypothetical protein
MPNALSASNDSSPFLDRVRAACPRKGCIYQTEKAYLRWIVRYVKYHGTEHPRVFGKPKVRECLSYLATERTVAASTQNQALSVLLRTPFCFSITGVLGADWEGVSDFEYGQITVRQGKGKKDRRTMLSGSLKAPLRRQLRKSKAIWQEDLEAGYGAASMPKALERKYSNAAAGWGWLCALPSVRRPKVREAETSSGTTAPPRRCRRR